MECERVRAAVKAGERLDAKAHAHAQDCNVCGALLADGGATARRLSAVESASYAPLPFASMAPLLEAERAPEAWLRNQSTLLRRSFAMGTATLFALAILAFAPRPDLAVVPRARMLAALAALVVTMAACVRFCIWPSQAKNPMSRTVTLVIVSALSVPLALALLPAAHWTVPLSREGIGEDWFGRAAACFSFGGLLAAPMFGVLLAADRRLSPRRALLIGAAALGLAANLVLQLHCPLTHPKHLIAGHATIGAVALLLAWGWSRLRYR